MPTLSPDHPPRMPEGRYRLLIAVLVVGALAALFAGIRATETPDDDASAGRPDVVERLIPRAGDEVIRQAELGIDLAPGYEGALKVNGVEIPTRELRLVPEQNQVFFTPGEGKAVEALRAGPNLVEAVVWRSSVGRGTANDLVFSWAFEAL